MKVTPIIKSITIFIAILVLFSSTIVYISINMIEETFDDVDKQRIIHTLDNLSPMTITLLKFNLEHFLSKNLKDIVTENPHILQIDLKTSHGVIVASSNDNKQSNTGVTTQTVYTKEILLGNKKYIFEAVPSNTLKSKSVEIYEEILLKLLLSVPFLIAIAVFLYGVIIALHNKDKEKAYEELKTQMDLEIHNHEKKTNMLFQQSRLASMGEMISNIAHQWRQPLNSISLVLQNLKLSYALNNLSKESFEEYTNKIEDSLQYMSQTITTFRNFYSSNKEQEIFSTTDVINESLSILQVNYEDKGIKIETILNEDAKISGYKNELTQVIVNILSNSKDIFEKRNTPNPKVSIQTLCDDQNRATISISDNGGGIDESILDKIFDPYFTTKHQEQGTGLGLYMSKIIINENFQGKLKVYNIKDGARFDIQLQTIKDTQ